MARFVEFTSWRGNKVYVNPEMVSGFEPDSESNGTGTVLSIGDEKLLVSDTLDEVLAKLQGAPEPQPAKAADDIAGWWLNPLGDVCWIIGRTTHDMFAYQFADRRHIYTLELWHLENWLRDRSRTSWLID